MVVLAEQDIKIIYPDGSMRPDTIKVRYSGDIEGKRNFANEKGEVRR